ncbi:MAG: helix-turn-helix transcriptional regulator [Oscillospiraceae bacterium]|nr:helix-turn-helix transcriptional regulator [Oscillospiraceae bacterium]
MLSDGELGTLKRIAKGVAAQFGGNCEVVVHEVSERSMNRSIVAIENGHVTGRNLGDGPSQVVLKQIGKKDDQSTDDHLCYLTRTPDGKVLKSSSMYIRDEAGKIAAIFCINFDISALAMAEQSLAALTSTMSIIDETPARISRNVNDLLDDLIDQSVRLIGKPVTLMTKDDKVRAIRFLNDHGALLITKSGDKIAKHYGISKYTLYSYLDVKTGGKNND